MRPIPWSYVMDWRCNACGLCCREFEVVLSVEEWATIAKRFGVRYTRMDGGKFYLRKTLDGSCVFLYNLGGVALCGLQDMKPLACKLWPFKVLKWPKYGSASKAQYVYMGRLFYVYVDPHCPQVVLGRPTEHLAHQVIPEVIELSLGLRVEQEKSTASLPAIHPLYIEARRRMKGRILC